MEIRAIPAPVSHIERVRIYTRVYMYIYIPSRIVHMLRSVVRSHLSTPMNIALSRNSGSVCHERSTLSKDASFMGGSESPCTSEISNRMRDIKRHAKRREEQECSSRQRGGETYKKLSCFTKSPIHTAPVIVLDRYAGNVRAPGDEAPCERAETYGGAAAKCIGCMYSQKYEEADTVQRALSIDEEEQRMVYNEMLELIESHYGKGTSNKELVEMVYEFYNSEIRQHWNYGEWSRRSIWSHIMYHMGNDRLQSTEMRSNLVYQIEGLRNHAWKKRKVEPDSDEASSLRHDFDGLDVAADEDSEDNLKKRSGKSKSQKTASTTDKYVIEPDYRAIRLMSELIKTHNLIQESQYRRTSHNGAAAH